MEHMKETADAAMAFLRGEIEPEENVDRLCMVRDHTSGSFAWRFAAKKMDPLTLILYTVFYHLMESSGYKKRIEDLEEEVKRLKGGQ